MYQKNEGGKDHSGKDGTQAKLGTLLGLCALLPKGPSQRPPCETLTRGRVWAREGTELPSSPHVLAFIQVHGSVISRILVLLFYFFKTSALPPTLHGLQGDCMVRAGGHMSFPRWECQPWFPQEGGGEQCPTHLEPACCLLTAECGRRPWRQRR